MHRSSVAFAIQAPENVARERVRAVVRFYKPCGEIGVRVRRDSALNLTVGELLIGVIAEAQETRNQAIFSAGEPLPAQLETAEQLLDASDARLRVLDGAQAAIAAADGRARVVAGATGSWFAAGDAYATSIAAAALLGAVTPLVDPDAIPELLVLGTSLGERTHLKGVRSLPPSTVVDFGSGEREVWSRLARWAAVAQPDAGRQAWGALVDTLSRRLEHEPAPWVRLDDQASAAILIAAAAELGIDLPSFTATDEFGAPAPAATTKQARDLALRNVLLGDGVAPLAPFATPGAPHTASCVVIGSGGQIARGTAYPNEILASVPADHRPAIEIRLGEWIEQATANGPANWSAFDMLLIEEGVSDARRRPVLPFATREPLRSPEFVRAISSLTPEVRATGDWLGEFAAGQDQADPPEPTPEDGWDRLPEIRDWLLEEPLSHPLLQTALGDLWVQRLRDGLREGDQAAAEQALAASAAVIFDQRLQAAAQPPPGSTSRSAA